MRLHPFVAGCVSEPPTSIHASGRLHFGPAQSFGPRQQRLAGKRLQRTSEQLGSGRGRGAPSDGVSTPTRARPALVVIGPEAQGRAAHLHEATSKEKDDSLARLENQVGERHGSLGTARQMDDKALSRLALDPVEAAVPSVG